MQPQHPATFSSFWSPTWSPIGVRWHTTLQPAIVACSCVGHFDASVQWGWGQDCREEIFSLPLSFEDSVCKSSLCWALTLLRLDLGPKEGKYGIATGCRISSWYLFLSRLLPMLTMMKCHPTLSLCLVFDKSFMRATHILNSAAQPTKAFLYKCGTIWGTINRLFSNMRFSSMKHCYGNEKNQPSTNVLFFGTRVE